MEVGKRVAEARAESGLTQAQLAAAVGIERSALAKIETGVRRVSVRELVAVARELGRRVEWFVDPGPAAIVSYRASKQGVATQPIDTELERIVQDVDFVVGQAPHLVANAPARPYPVPADMAAAEQFASEARTRLGLPPDEPAANLAPLVAEIGLLPFAIPLGEGADAGTVMLGTGGVTIINGDRQLGRRRLALAHELGHYLVADPYTLDWRIDSADATDVEARLDRFARALLLPAADLRRRWHKWCARLGESLRDAAVRAGSHYQVDMATLARRLSELDLADAGQVNQLRQVRTKRADIVEKNLVVPRELEPVALPRRYEQEVLKLYRREVITSDRALGLLLGTFDHESLPDRAPATESLGIATTSTSMFSLFNRRAAR